MERVKWSDKIKIAVVLERVGERKIMLKLTKKGKRNWMDYWLRRNCLLNDALEQRFSNYGPRTTCGPRDLPLWSLKNTEEKLKFK